MKQFGEVFMYVMLLYMAIGLISGLLTIIKRSIFKKAK